MSTLKFFFFLNSLLAIATLSAQRDTICSKPYNLIQTIQKNHYQPKLIDSSFTEIMTKKWLENIDPTFLYFTAEDLNTINAQTQNLSFLEENKSCAIITIVTDLYNKRLKNAFELTNQFNAIDLNFKSSDSIVLRYKDEFRATTALKDKWRKLLTLKTYNSYLNQYDSINKVTFPKPETIKEYKEQVVKTVQCDINSKLENSSTLFVTENLLKAIAYSFDPHTTYFSNAQENEFNTSLSKYGLSFGVEIELNDLGNLEITGITPGGAAWNSNQLNDGDIILAIHSESKSVKEINCTNFKEAEKLLSSEDELSLKFEILKPSKVRKQITLTKQEAVNRDNLIKSFILEKNNKIGYIYLPAFYTNQDELSYLPNGCANDFAKELLKLKREGIEGLILDLRNNGGGSMLEAVRLSGLFINLGTISIIESDGDEPQLLKDLSRGTSFSKPLVVLVNKFSASASELFAGTMQDYNRALIVGGSTFGKSTMQNIIPYDVATNYYMPNEEPSGYVKITNGMFFRITGESHQKIGVQPDILIPTKYENIEISESNYQTALANKKTTKKGYYTALSPLSIDEIKIKSDNRLKQSKQWSAYKNEAVQLGEQLKGKKYNLNFTSYSNSYFEEDNLEVSTVLENTFKVAVPAYNQSLLSTSKKQEDELKIIKTSLKSDLELEETYNIMIDLINTKKNK
ncbi:MAG: carboxy terminal-processing peptidase [Lishizhenia sp.]